MVFGTTTDYTRKYDLDLVREVAGDQIARRVVLLSDQAFGLENVKEVALRLWLCLERYLPCLPLHRLCPTLCPFDFTQGRKQTRYTISLQAP